MKKGIAALRALIVSLALSLVVTSLAADEAVGNIAVLQGKAQVFEGGKWVAARVGSLLYAQSAVQTAYGSKVIIAFRNGAQVALIG